MGRLIYFSACALVVILVGAGAANATHNSGTGPGQDLVVGTGQFVGLSPFGPVDVAIHGNANSGPSGEDAGGHFSFGGQTVFGPLSIEGAVTCLRVVGNKASVGFEVTKSNSPVIPEGSGGIFIFVDNGSPGTADEWEGVPVPAPPAVCPPPSFRETRPITQGNFVVDDATQ